MTDRPAPPDSPDGRPRRRISPPATAGLILAAGLAGFVGWLWWQGEPPPPAPRPAAVASTPAPAPIPAPQAPAVPPPPVEAEAPKPPAPEPAPPPPAATAPADTPPAAPPRPAEPAPSPPSASPAPPPAAAAPPAGQPASAPPRPAAAPSPPPPAVAAVTPPPQPKAVEPTGPLPPAPDPALVKVGPQGPLPVIAPDGRKPWQVYARPFDGTDRRPRIAIVIGDMGLSQSATLSAITRLPPPVTLAFAPYASDLQSWIAQARAAGHEVLLQLPMEPIDYPTNDPGPRALLTSLKPADNIERLDWLLSRFAGYVGVTNYMGSKFTTSPGDLKPVLEQLAGRGLLFLDSRSAARSVAPRIAGELGMPRVLNDRFIDNEASRTAIDARLEELERIALKNTAAVGMGYPYPVSIERVAAWAQNLAAKGIVLAPVSAIVNRQPE